MDNFLLSLQITLLGMGLVFGAIILLWGLMTLLTEIAGLKRDADAPSADTNKGAADKARVAAVAVATALAEQSQSSARPLPAPPTSIVSAWQLGMRTRQMTEKGERR